MKKKVKSTIFLQLKHSEITKQNPPLKNLMYFKIVEIKCNNKENPIVKAILIKTLTTMHPNEL